MEKQSGLQHFKSESSFLKLHNPLFPIIKMTESELNKLLYSGTYTQNVYMYDYFESLLWVKILWCIRKLKRSVLYFSLLNFIIYLLKVS